MAVGAESARGQESERRAWWLRTLLVLTSPRAVFVALRDQTDEASAERQEPLLALILLGGIAGVLATSIAGRLLDDRELDGLLVAVWAFVGGSFYGTAAYWLVGAALHVGARGLGSQGTYRRTRQLLGFASAPLALSLLVLWPIRLAVFGGDVFRSGGSDSGTAGSAFVVLQLVFVLWALVLALVGVRTVHGWTWGRAAATVAIAGLLPALVVAAARI